MSSVARSDPGQSRRHSLSVGTRPYVVVIFGRTGVGVSSLINLIIGHPISPTHSDAQSHAQKLIPYAPVTFPGSDKQFCLYEVPGFSGLASDAAILEAVRKIDQQEGIDLFVYCLRKQRAMVMPTVVRYIRDTVAGEDVPMIAVVTELERFDADGGMEDWWDVPLSNGHTNGTLVEEMCLGMDDAFDAHACVTTLPRREVDLVEKLRKRRDISEERVRQLIMEQCGGPKRPALGYNDPHSCCCGLSNLFTLATPQF